MLILIVGPLISGVLFAFSQVPLPRRPAARMILAKSNTRTMMGIVRAHRTHKPLSGIEVACSDGGNATTSASGVFRIDDLPIKSFYFVVVRPSWDQPYTRTALHVRAEKNSMPHVINIELAERRINPSDRPAHIDSLRRFLARFFDDYLSRFAPGGYSSCRLK
jgi:hypothetical protein